MEWAQESLNREDSVRLFDAGRLGSLDPKEVRAELESIAQFLEIPLERAGTLASAAYRSRDSTDGCAEDYGITREALRDGFLPEQSGKSLHVFENTMNACSSEVAESWNEAVAKYWLVSRHEKIVELARTALKGVNSIPPLNLVYSMKGEALHAEGKCRPCVFALRGKCRNEGDMCLYCHLDHPRTKRASLKARNKKKRANSRLRVRTPSPSQSPRGGFHPDMRDWDMREYAMSVAIPLSVMTLREQGSRMTSPSHTVSPHGVSPLHSTLQTLVVG